MDNITEKIVDEAIRLVGGLVLVIGTIVVEKALREGEKD